MGTYGEWKDHDDWSCVKCDSTKIKYRLWESSDGGHEDIQYKCLSCNHHWWVEGCDA